VNLRVEPQTVAATLRLAWPSRTKPATAQCPVDAAAPQGPHDGAAWSSDGLDAQSPAIENVLQELERTSPLRGARLDIELSDSLVHLDVIDGDFVGQTDRQLQTIAVACVTELLGDRSGDHEVRWQLQSDDRHLLICAVLRERLAALAEAASVHGLRLASVQPDFVLQWNRHAGALKAGPAVFAVTTGADIAIAWVKDGVIAALSVGPLTESPVTLTLPSQPVGSDPEEDRNASAGMLQSRIDSLLSGFGLEPQRRTQFSATQPQPLSAVELLDCRVDRLLAGLGQDAAAQSAFVLVAPDMSSADLSPRWTVTTHSAVAA
jgi:hypothetical protein